MNCFVDTYMNGIVMADDRQNMFQFTWILQFL